MYSDIALDVGIGGECQAYNWNIDYCVKKGAVSDDRRSQICFSRDFNSRKTCRTFVSNILVFP